MLQFLSNLLIFIVLSSILSEAVIPKANSSNKITVSSYRHHYHDSIHQQRLEYGKASQFKFQRFQSPAKIKKSMDTCRGSPFKWFHGKDGRKGFVSSTKLGGDWVLAESEQIAPDCTTEDVLKAYLTGVLQEQWNKKEVLECKFKVDHFGKCYHQDLVLRSQRVIKSQTGIMRYSQRIAIDKIGDQNYTVMVHLDPKHQSRSTTDKKPFESLSVYVGLEQKNKNVHIYAAGVMKVNRKVVPNLILFDASGIAGQMAGKGTLWLAALFEQKRQAREKSTLIE
jgi:hypothetical protein